MKVAASLRIYMGRCPKVVFKSPVTGHSSLLIPNPQSLIPNPLLLIPAFKLRLWGGAFIDYE